MTTPIVILGAGGFARETLDVIDAINILVPTWEMVGFIVDTAYVQSDFLVNAYPVLGDFGWLADHPGVSVVCGVHNPEVRQRMVRQSSQYRVAFATLIHPTVVRTRWIEIAEGTVITAGCILSNQIRIGAHVHLNPGSIIGHDVNLEAYVSIAPGVHVSGSVHVQEGAYIGTGANIIEKKSIGAWSIVGAGSTVIRDVPPNATVVGSPAQVIKQRSEGWHLDEN